MNKYLLLLLLNVLFFSTCFSVCVPYQGSSCSRFVSKNGVAIEKGAQELIEMTLEVMGWGNITKIADVLAPDCSHHAQAFVCNYFFPPCDLNNGGGIKLCKDVCLNFKSVCSIFLNSSATEEILGYLPDCETFQVSNCTNLDFVDPIDYSSIVCPSPLIPNPNPEKQLKTCPGGYCCLPCPFSFNFYPEGEGKKIDDFITFMPIVCSLFTIPLLIAYVFIPSKRKFPHVLVIYLSIGFMIAYFPMWLRLAGKDFECNNSVEQADYSNAGCVFQGNFSIYGLLTSILWFCSISVNLFLVVMFEFENYSIAPIIYPIVGWGLPIIPIIVLNANRGFGMTFFICATNSFELTESALAIPSSIFIFFSLFCTVVVFAKIFMIARVSKNGFQTIVNIQGRPLIASFIGTLTLIGYWVFIRSSKLIPESVTQDWFICIASGNGQNYCSTLLEEYLISPAKYIATFFFFSMLGPIAFVIFALKKDIFEAWRELMLESKVGPMLTKMKLFNETKMSDYYEPRSRNETQMDIEG